MNIVQIYKDFPTKDDCVKHLEKIRWGNKPKCPYCGSGNNTPYKDSHRYQCIDCKTAFSVTVNTIFHATKLDLQKWFVAISMILNNKKGLSSRALSRHINVNKDTAWYMQMRVRKAMIENNGLLEGIVEADETYVGGRNINRHFDKKIEGTQGRSGKDKTTILGAMQRGGKVIAQKAKDSKRKTVDKFINKYVKKGAILSTDEWKSYWILRDRYKHIFVCHNDEEYVRGLAHVNTLENFWSLLKRGIIGQYHRITKKHLQKYIYEFCFRYNHRNNPDVFNLLLKRAVNLE